MKSGLALVLAAASFLLINPFPGPAHGQSGSRSEFNDDRVEELEAQQRDGVLKDIQSMLKSHDLYTGRIDGDFGPKSSRAWLKFAEAAGVDPQNVQDLVLLLHNSTRSFSREADDLKEKIWWGAKLLESDYLVRDAGKAYEAGDCGSASENLGLAFSYYTEILDGNERTLDRIGGMMATINLDPGKQCVEAAYESNRDTGLALQASTGPAWQVWIVGSLQLREEPDQDAKSAGRLKAASLVELVDRKGGWSRVRREDGTEGWVENIHILNTATVFRLQSHTPRRASVAPQRRPRRQQDAVPAQPRRRATGGACGQLVANLNAKIGRFNSLCRGEVSLGRYSNCKWQKRSLDAEISAMRQRCGG